MRYAVIVCPKCGKAKGVETRRKTTSCPCGRTMVISRTRRYFETDSPSALADAVAEANAQLGEGRPPKARRRRRPKGPYAEVAERARAGKDPLERMRLIAEGLTASKGSFGLEDVKRVAALVGRESPEEVVSRLREHSLVYEVSEGEYRSV